MRDVKAVRSLTIRRVANERSIHLEPEEREMPQSGKVTEAKGRIEEAAGALRDNEQQRTKGKADQSSGKLKQAGEKLSGVADDLKDAMPTTSKDAIKK